MDFQTFQPLIHNLQVFCGKSVTGEEMCPCLDVNLEMGFGHFIPVFAHVVGIEELYEFIKRCKTRHVRCFRALRSAKYWLNRLPSASQ